MRPSLATAAMFPIMTIHCHGRYSQEFVVLEIPKVPAEYQPRPIYLLVVSSSSPRLQQTRNSAPPRVVVPRQPTPGGSARPRPLLGRLGAKFRSPTA